MRLVVAEKPSVARDIARVLGARSRGEGCFEGPDLRVTWCVGHLAELVSPEDYDPAWKSWAPELLPLLPPAFRVRPRQEGGDQWKLLRGHLRDRAVTEIINACDAGREGELIFRWVLELAGVQKPVRRLWVSSLTDEALRQGFASLRPHARQDGLAAAARCRAEADWLVGMNATRALTALARRGGGDQLLSVGRVQTPTLAMIVARDREIAAFIPEDFWTVRASFDTPAGPFEATFFQEPPVRLAPGPDAAPPAGAEPPPEPDAEGDAEPEVAPRAERLPTEALAAAVAAAVAGATGAVSRVERKRTRERPPLLYDLTSLQRRANQRYGFSADRTLAIAQALYERHKLITYPRTDSRHLTPDEVPTLPGVLGALAAVPAYAPFAVPLRDGPPLQPGRRVVDAAEVGDHHAILPTDRSPLSASLSADEKRVYDLVARRLLAVLLPDAVFDLAAVVVTVPPGAPLPAPVRAPLHFRARGRVCVDPGWQAADPPRTPQKDRVLPPVDEGMPAAVTGAAVAAGQTRPPRPHSDASILKSMETAGRFLDDADLKRALRGAGLGTPATRASILETLVDRKFVERKGKELRATPLGMSLIDAVPVDELKSAELTGRWEERLSRMAEGGDDRAAFMDAVRARVGELVGAILAAAPPPAQVAVRDGPSLGPCPACGAPVRDGGKVYRCDTGRSCPFVIFKEMSGKKLGVRLVRALLKEGETPVVEGFESKAGKAFSAALALSPEKKVVFRFSDTRPGAATPPPGAAPAASPAAGASGGAGPAPTRSRARGPAGPPAGSASAAAPPPAPPVARPGPARAGDPCPACGTGTVIAGRAGLGCARWREGCGFRAPFPPEG